MISKAIRDIADRMEQLESKIPSWKSLKFAMLVALLCIAAFTFGVGAFISMILSTPAALGSLFAAFPTGILLWTLWYMRR